MKNEVIIYTDGSCSGNPGPGGYAAILLQEAKKHEITGGQRLTTNNRMELIAAISGLIMCSGKCEIILHSDSKYLVDGITKWLPSWKKNKWRKSDKKEIENIDLWQMLDLLNNKLKITWRWVKGHANNTMNERADYLARTEMEKYY
ncbi:MAG: ribonuclease HI [Pseudomonadota bacterium]